jgi:adenylylsulfate kinase
MVNLDKGTCFWFTGFAASGKSTVAREVEKILRGRGIRVENLDADEIRANISPDLKYTAADRDLNTKRLAWISALLCRNGVCSIVAAVSPLRSHRDRARGWIDHFTEVWVSTPIEECQKRDPKGLFAKAARGEVNDIAGLHQPYEEPEDPEVVVETMKLAPEEAAFYIIRRAEELGFLPAVGDDTDVYSAEEKAKLEKRLEDLGYM